jgi:hypothetical protein
LERFMAAEAKKPALKVHLAARGLE